MSIVLKELLTVWLYCIVVMCCDIQGFATYWIFRSYGVWHCHWACSSQHFVGTAVLQHIWRYTPSGLPHRITVTWDVMAHSLLAR